MYICIHFCWAGLCQHLFRYFVNASGGVGSYGKHMFNFVKTLANCFPRWLHHFAFLSAVYKGSHSTTWFGHFVLSLLNFSCSARCVVVSHEISVCFSQITRGVEHLFMYLFAILYLFCHVYSGIL